MSDTNVLTFRPKADAPVQPLPRSVFGLRSADVAAGMEAAGDADREQQLRIKRLAREARNALDSGAHVCPTLKRSLASRFEMLAKMASILADEAEAQGFLAHGVSAVEIAGIAETIAAEIEADLPEGA